MPTHSAVSEYRKRVKYSFCKGLTSKRCSKRRGCAYANKGTKRKFCRKKRNTRRIRVRKLSSSSRSFASAKSRKSSSNSFYSAKSA